MSVVATVLAVVSILGSVASQPPDALLIDSSAPPALTQPLAKFWQASVGSGHAALGVPGAIGPASIPLAPGDSLGAMWQRQLRAVRDDTGIRGVRFHGTFDDDMGPVVVPGSCSDAALARGCAYNWTRVDALYDAILAAGVTPIVELSFMPQAIADCAPGTCHTMMHYKGITAHPRSWEAWGELVGAFARHAVARHGLEEVARWRFEVWNEMWGIEAGDMGASGQAANSPYMALYNASYFALKAVSRRLRVGGPATAELQEIRGFVQGLRAWGIGADFVSTHSYPTDACNARPDARTRLDCFADGITAARRQAPNHTFLMTEFNCGWKNNAIHDGESRAYAASFLFRTVNALAGSDVAALSWWSFSSLFEEPGLPTDEFGPFGANSALQTVHGVPLPIYRGFEMLARAGDTRLPVYGNARANQGWSRSRGPSPSHAFNQSGPLTVLATLNTSARALSVFLSNFAPDDGKGPDPGAAPPVGRGAGAGTCFSMKPNPCTERDCYLKDTDFPGGDLLPEASKFRTDNASACCAACHAYKPDKFCQAWSWKSNSSSDPRRCYLKSASAVVKKKHSAGMTAGYPTGIAPPSGDRPYYDSGRDVELTLATRRGHAGGVAPGARTAALLRVINSTCANPKRLWADSMGSVTWPSDVQLATLRTASQPCEERVALVWRDAGSGTLHATLNVSLEAYAAVTILVSLA
eukprot:g5685.t1